MRRARVVLPWAALAVVLVLLALGGSTGGDDPSAAAVPARVTRVVDGDTVHVRMRGHDETVRYIGMDTPETVKPDTPVQCYGEHASRLNHRLVAGRAVLLRFDAQHHDVYGRLLAYVYRRSDGLFIDAALVRRGAARTLTIPPNTAHAALLARLQRRARAAGRGLWRAC